MNRQALAFEALTLSRSILRQVPVSVRIASLAQGFLQQAFSRDDMHLAIGLLALVSMEEAGTPGSIEGSTIEDLRPYIKRNALSKLKGVAHAIGGKIFNLSLAGRRKIPLPVAEEAWNNYTLMLQRHPLTSDKNVGQVISYIANGFTMRIKDVLESRSTREEIRKNPEFGESIHHERDSGPSEVALWKEIEHKFKSDPELLGPKGEPWAWIYIEGKAGGMSEAQIIDQWNEASRRSGGEGAVNRSIFLNWLRAIKRKALMEELTKRYLDEDTIKRLKLAVARGALQSTLLQPFERDLLRLLAA